MDQEDRDTPEIRCPDCGGAWEALQSKMDPPPEDWPIEIPKVPAKYNYFSVCVNGHRFRWPIAERLWRSS
jgi:hypothetical protein